MKFDTYMVEGSVNQLSFLERFTCKHICNSFTYRNTVPNRKAYGYLEKWI
jgi:hypothetical protein